MDNKCLNCSSPGIYKKKEKSNVAKFFNEVVIVEEEVWQCDVCGESFLTDEYKDFSNEIFKAVKRVKEGETENKTLTKAIHRFMTRRINDGSRIAELEKENAGLRRILFGNVNRIGYYQLNEIKTLERRIVGLIKQIEKLEEYKEHHEFVLSSLNEIIGEVWTLGDLLNNIEKMDKTLKDVKEYAISMNWQKIVKMIEKVERRK
jgi:YgiT-type zinc finger domain-containing protein